MPEKISIEKTTNLENEEIFRCCFPICSKLYKDIQLKSNTKGDLEKITYGDGSSYFQEIYDEKDGICDYYLKSKDKNTLLKMIDAVSENYRIRYELSS